MRDTIIISRIIVLPGNKNRSDGRRHSVARLSIPGANGHYERERLPPTFASIHYLAADKVDESMIELGA